MRSVFVFFAVLFPIIAIVHSISWAAHYGGWERIKTFRLLFDMNSEATLAAFYNSLLLLAVSVLMWMHGKIEGVREIRRGWLLLAAVFFFLSWDEAAEIHEKLNKFTTAALGGGDLGIFKFSWVIPYLGLLIVLAIVLIPFMRRLNRKLLLRLILAGLVYVGGAMGVEMISATMVYESAGYKAVTTLEECLEISGLLLCFYFLMQALPSGERAIHLDTQQR